MQARWCVALVVKNDAQQADRQHHAGCHGRVRGAGHTHGRHAHVAEDERPIHERIHDVGSDQRHHDGSHEIHRLQVSPEDDVREQWRRRPHEVRHVGREFTQQFGMKADSRQQCQARDGCRHQGH